MEIFWINKKLEFTSRLEKGEICRKKVIWVVGQRGEQGEILRLKGCEGGGKKRFQEIYW